MYPISSVQSSCGHVIGSIQPWFFHEEWTGALEEPIRPLMELQERTGTPSISNRILRETQERARKLSRFNTCSSQKCKKQLGSYLVLDPYKVLALFKPIFASLLSLWLKRQNAGKLHRQRVESLLTLSGAIPPPPSLSIFTYGHRDEPLEYWQSPVCVWTFSMPSLTLNPYISMILILKIHGRLPHSKLTVKGLYI